MAPGSEILKSRRQAQCDWCHCQRLYVASHSTAGKQTVAIMEASEEGLCSMWCQINM